VEQLLGLGFCSCVSNCIC